MPFISGKTHTAAALNLMCTQMFTPDNGDRYDVPNYAIVITDGESNINPELTLPEAIRKMTSFPAQRLGLHDRGRLLPGLWADVVVFDMERLHDRATNLYPHTFPFENYPHQYPQGIDYVFVNGVMVVDGERHCKTLPGRVLRHVA